MTNTSNQWTSLGPPQVHWFGPMFFSALIAIANFAIYMSTIDYMVSPHFSPSNQTNSCP